MVCTACGWNIVHILLVGCHSIQINMTVMIFFFFFVFLHKKCCLLKLQPAALCISNYNSVKLELEHLVSQMWITQVCHVSWINVAARSTSLRRKMKSDGTGIVCMSWQMILFAVESGDTH